MPKKPTYEELQEQLEEMKKRNDVEFRVGDKGGVSVYGLGSRFPVTLYFEQWMKLLDVADKLRKFLIDNKSKLKLKN